MLKPFLIIFSVVLLLPNFFKNDINPTLSYDGKEHFDPQLGYLNSIAKLSQHIDSLATAQQISSASFEYVRVAVTVIKYRFYHGFSHFSFNDNWIAAVAGRYIEEGLGCKVQPEGIMQCSNAACSQQALVMMAVLREKNITYRSIGFPHHYALEVLLDKNWYFFDANMEPEMTKEQRMASNWKYQADNLKQYYDRSRFPQLDYVFGKGLTTIRGKINEVPALKARIFQATTGILSKILWCLPLLMLWYRPRMAYKPRFSLPIFRKKTSPSLAV